jgi:hypothetical protein
MKIILSILLIFSFSVSLVFGQNYQPGKLWVSVTSIESRALDDSSTTNTEINSIFRSYNVHSYKQLMGFAKTPHLRAIYEISCDCDQNELMQQLMPMIPDYFGFIDQIYEPVSLYHPEDGVWDYRHGSWHLKRIQADSAWEITIGNPQIRVGVIDQPPDVTHPDLESQIFPHYNPLNGTPYHAMLDNEFAGTHGTPVASFVAAATAEEGDYDMSPNGYLAAIGFKIKMTAYSPNDMPSAVHASTVMGSDVITNSWSSGCKPSSVSMSQVTSVAS